MHWLKLRSVAFRDSTRSRALDTTATCTLDSQLGCAVEYPSPSKVPLPHRWSSSASSSEELLPAQACTSPPAEARLEPFPEPPQVSFMERWQDAGLAGTPRKLRRTSDNAAFSPWADASQDTGGDLEDESVLLHKSEWAAKWKGLVDHGDLEDESLEVPEKDPCYESPLPRGWTPPDSPLIGPKTPKTQAIADELDAGLASFLGPSNVRQDLPSSSSAADADDKEDDDGSEDAIVAISSQESSAIVAASPVSAPEEAEAETVPGWTWGDQLRAFLVSRGCPMQHLKDYLKSRGSCVSGKKEDLAARVFSVMVASGKRPVGTNCAIERWFERCAPPLRHEDPVEMATVMDSQAPTS